MSEVTLLCRIDSMHDKKYVDKQVSTVLKQFSKNFKGRKSQITPDSDLERKYVFHELGPADAARLTSIATDNQAQLCMKTCKILDASKAGVLAVPNSLPSAPKLELIDTPGRKSSLQASSPASSLASSPTSISSSTKSLVMNFGLDSPSAPSDGRQSPSCSSSSPSSSAKSPPSFFSSPSESESESDSTGSDVGVGIPVTTPEIVILRDLAEIMKVSSVKRTPSSIGKDVSKWFITEKVQNVMRRIV